MGKNSKMKRIGKDRNRKSASKFGENVLVEIFALFGNVIIYEIFRIQFLGFCLIFFLFWFAMFSLIRSYFIKIVLTNKKVKMVTKKGYISSYSYRFIGRTRFMDFCSNNGKDSLPSLGVLFVCFTRGFAIYRNTAKGHGYVSSLVNSIH